MFARSHRLVLSLIVTGLVTAALPARAWHDEGHRIVARVAERFLTDKTRAELRRILGTEEVGRGLAVAATYMDDHKPMLANQIQGSANWHFDSMPVCPVSQPANYCANGVCASAQINAHIAMLADPVNHDGIKLQTVRYLTHLIGDIQQPLHASGNDDRGGNDIKLTPVFESYGFYDNLHSLWDGYWVKKALRTSKLKEADYADALVTRYQDKASEWAQGDVQAWIKESNTVSREVVYGRLPGWACGKKTEGPLTLERDYLMVGDELVPERLFKGGVRLAKVLNTALGK